MNVLQIGDRVQGECWGSEKYVVQFRVQDGEFTAEHCTCPYDWGGWCKHLVALGLTYLNDCEEVMVIGDFQDFLTRQSKENLVQLINTIVDQCPEAIHIVINHQTLQEQLGSTKLNQQVPLIQLDVFKYQITQILQGVDYDDSCGSILRQLRQFNPTLKSLRDRGDWVNLGRLYSTLIEVMNEFYNDEMIQIDYDGDIMVQHSEWVVGLGECLQQSPNLDSIIRESWLMTLLETWLQDLKIGGIDYGVEAEEFLISEANDEEWEIIEAEIKSRYSQVSEWAQETLTDCLCKRRKQDDNLAAAQGIIDMMGTPRQKIQMCLESDQFDRALDLLESLLHDTHLVSMVADALVQQDADRAIKLVKQAQDLHPSYQYGQWLIKYYTQQQDWEHVFEWEYLVFQEDFSIKGYQKVRAIAQKLEN
jgi:uncharacterized Zn finger protein